MSFSSRFFLYAPTGVFVAFVLAVVALWTIDSRAMAKKLDAWNGHQVMPGVTLRFAGKQIGGFPFRVDGVLSDLQVTVATDHGPASWKSEKFALHELTYGGKQFVFEAAGKQTLTWTDAKGRAHGVVFVPGSMRASALARMGGLSRFDLDIVGVGSPALTAARMQFHMRHNPTTDGLDIAVSADAVRLSPPLRSAFGDTITQFVFTGTLAPGHAFDRLFAGSTTWQDAAERWRTMPGSLRADSILVAWDKLAASGHGTLALDEMRRPRGLLDFKIAGMQKLIAGAREGQVADGANKGLAAALLDRAAKAGSDPSAQLGAVIGAKDGIVYVGDEPAGMVGTAY